MQQVATLRCLKKMKNKSFVAYNNFFLMQQVATIIFAGLCVFA